MATVAFIGLGTMGFHMAGHLACEGHQVTVFNRTQAKAEVWCEEFAGGSAGSPREAAEGADFVMTCVGNDEQLRAVLLGETGALAGMTVGSVLVDHTTASADIAREMAALAAGREVGFLDAPVSGGQSGAEGGMLTVMVGGDQALFERAAPVIESYAKRVKRMGPVGSGQLTKMVNQICVGGLLQALAEALQFARHAGLDVPSAMDIISHGAAQSWQLEHRYQTMLEGKFDNGFAVDWMRKDFAMVFEEAKRNGAQLPVTELVDQYYAEVQAQGGGRWDTSSLITRLK